MKAWIIYDSRAHVMDPDDASVYEAFAEEEGDTLESVIKTREKDWPGGAIYSYDIDKDGKTLINQTHEG